MSWNMNFLKLCLSQVNVPVSWRITISHSVCVPPSSTLWISCRTSTAASTMIANFSMTQLLLRKLKWISLLGARLFKNTPSTINEQIKGCMVLKSPLPLSLDFLISKKTVLLHIQRQQRHQWQHSEFPSFKPCHAIHLHKKRQIWRQ